MRFSQRKKLKPAKKIIQRDSMDADLRNGLWNGLYIYFWEKNKEELYLSGLLKFVVWALWVEHFKLPLDDIDTDWRIIYRTIEKTFKSFDWFEVYDFVEFVADAAKRSDRHLDVDGFIGFCNKVLEEENSAYRFVGGYITEITSEEEISEIDEALAAPYEGVRIHLQSALEKLSDRTNRDYRNSIKESISAVESLAQEITGKPKATLTQALKTIESQVPLHGALSTAFEKLYGYTSDASGIRHALSEESDIDFHDAKFMLVSCSAFTNYMIGKSQQ